MSYIYSRLAKFVDLLDRLLLPIAMASALLTAFLILISIIARYFLHSSLSWTYEVISLYLSVFMFFPLLSSTLADNSHISIDIVSKYISRRYSVPVYFIISLVSFLLFSLITYAASINLYISISKYEISQGSYSWPLWPHWLIIAIGSAAIALRLLLSVLNSKSSTCLAK